MEDVQPSSTPIISLPQHWLDSEHVAFGAKLLDVFGSSSGKLRQLVFSRLNAPIELSTKQPILTEKREQEYVSRLETFTPATLKALCSLQDTALGTLWLPHRPYWKRATAKLQRDGEVSPVAGAKLIADRLLAGNLTGPQLASVALHELNRDWGKSQDV